MRGAVVRTVALAIASGRAAPAADTVRVCGYVLTSHGIAASEAKLRRHGAQESQPCDT